MLKIHSVLYFLVFLVHSEGGTELRISVVFYALSQCLKSLVQLLSVIHAECIVCWAQRGEELC